MGRNMSILTSATMDFAGTDDQVKASLNSTLSFTKSNAYAAMRTLLRSDIPNNSPASSIDRSPASQRLNTSRNFCILRSCSHAARFIAPLLCRATKPDNSCAT